MHSTRSIIHRSLTMAAYIALAASLTGCGMKSQNSESFEQMAYPEIQNGPEMTADQHERMGDDLHERNSPEMAYVHYTRALASSGTSNQQAATLQVKKGLVLFSQGHDEAALKEFQTVLAQHPNHALANEAAGAVYLKAGLSREARAHFEKAAALDASLWRTQQYLGMLASREGRYDDAIRYFSVSLELRPGQPGTMNNLGVAHLMNTDYDQALTAFRRALAAGAPQTKTYNNIGLALARMGRTQEALQTFRFGGDDSKAHNNLGYVLLLQGENEQAIYHFEQAIELSPNYYAKAFSNLKQAKLALGFAQAGSVRISDMQAPLHSAPQILPQPLPSANPEPIPAPVLPIAPVHQVTPDNQNTPAPVSALQYVPFQNASTTTGSSLSLKTKSIQSEQLPTEKNTSINTGKFGLHVASFRSHKRTATYVTELESKGVSSMVMSVDIDGTRWQRVLAGRFDDTSAAVAARPQLLTTLGLTSAPIQKFTGSGSLLPPQADGSRTL